MKYVLTLSLTVLGLMIVSAQDIPVFTAQAEPDANFFETINGKPSQVLPGCSWYCGGQVHAFNATSQLPAYESVNYGPQQAHDFDVQTAWVEGKEGHGIGERLTYTFDMREHDEHNLGITHLLIANGYKKSEALWRKNNRVKRLRVYINQKVHCDVILQDVFTFQRVRIGDVSLPQKNVLTMSFEIREVYPGDRYQDTAISELLIDGFGVH
mgnify:CR=1 FL=1